MRVPAHFTSASARTPSVVLPPQAAFLSARSPRTRLSHVPPRARLVPCARLALIVLLPLLHVLCLRCCPETMKRRHRTAAGVPSSSTCVLTTGGLVLWRDGVAVMPPSSSATVHRPPLPSAHAAQTHPLRRCCGPLVCPAIDTRRTVAPTALSASACAPAQHTPPMEDSRHLKSTLLQHRNSPAGGLRVLLPPPFARLHTSATSAVLVAGSSFMQ
ncbi:hypothetical protein MVEN_02377700 [Mycena venus]|uniref:Uncharacterized protein n=1 Tax=Mycena venus TaxID=2733690 RepID=A0A8H6X2C1_9AGAR|nr:hypothetical protein MVEN_02377700 [Mycena venus]